MRSGLGPVIRCGEAGTHRPLTVMTWNLRVFFGQAVQNAPPNLEIPLDHPLHFRIVRVGQLSGPVEECPSNDHADRVCVWHPISYLSSKFLTV